MTRAIQLFSLGFHTLTVTVRNTTSQKIYTYRQGSPKYEMYHVEKDKPASDYPSG